MGGSRGSGRSLVNTAVALYNSIVFTLLGGLVVLAEGNDLLALVHRQNSSAVSHVCHVAILSYYQNDYGAGAGSFNHDLISIFIFVLRLL